MNLPPELCQSVAERVGIIAVTGFIHSASLSPRTRDLKDDNITGKLPY